MIGVVEQGPTGPRAGRGPAQPDLLPRVRRRYVGKAKRGPVLRFTCQVGHVYSVESMLSEQGSAAEAAMWSAMRILEERAGR